jgi:hypothetical protein
VGRWDGELNLRGDRYGERRSGFDSDFSTECGVGGCKMRLGGD